jgi:ferredoxin
VEDAVKVRVNHDLCEGHGKCEQAAPDVFDLRDDDLSYVKVDEVPADLHEAVRRAFRLCPRQAIIIEE